MPRGSNSQEEQDRISSGEKGFGRQSGRGAGTGAPAHEKPGYGNDSMQKNPAGEPKESL